VTEQNANLSEDTVATGEDEEAAIAAAIIVDAGRVLMVRRRVNEGNLSWQFPAGQVEVGETGEEAAVRETREEVGLKVRPTKKLGERIHPITGRTMLYIACEVIEGTAHVADKEELAEVEWCGRSTLERYVPYPFYRPVQEYFEAALSLEG
jgi:8-oxo-dGTP diphosphatase